MFCFASVELRRDEIRQTAEYKKRISEEFDRNTAEARERHRMKVEAQEREQEPQPKRKEVTRRGKPGSLEDLDLEKAITFAFDQLRSRSSITPEPSSDPARLRLTKPKPKCSPTPSSRPSKSYARMKTGGCVPKNVRNNEKARMARATSASTSTQPGTSTPGPTGTAVQPGVPVSTPSSMPPPPAPGSENTPRYGLRPKDKVRKTEHAQKTYRM